MANNLNHMYLFKKSLFVFKSFSTNLCFFHTGKSCGKPIVEESTTIEGNSYLYGDKVTIECTSGNEYILTCNSAGKWIGKQDSSC